MQKIFAMATRFTFEQYQKLKDAIATGVKSVNYGDKTVSYMSFEEMRKILGMMEEELFPARFGRRRRVAAISRGYLA